MVWDQLSINKPHLVYIILGGFTSIFMLVSLFIKEKLYIGEATMATLCGLIFGPHAANLIDPGTWGNTDQITLEFSRIVLVVQCFAVGVELPKAYMERHWLSVVMLLVPVMTFGWLVTSLFVWWMIIPLTWLESLCVAACVTATDPVLASSVVGKGKFAKRVPKHIRDLLSAESGCNDGMAFPFIYLALNLIHYHLDAKHVIQHWFCNTILYECVWGAVYGVLIGYIGRHAIKLAEKRGIIDRESFLVFYFVLALFCAGSGSMLGMDDLLVGFAAGVGFSNDGWFTEKTEESHVSNVIDLLLNLTYFVYLGTIIPWDQYNSGLHGLQAWRLVVIALLVIFFRRIPIMLALKPVVPDIKTWREALFCGHFGPIGVGAIFVAILARAELESGSTTPLAVLPNPDDAEYVLIYTIWPIVTFLVITSIVVHGSSIAVFTLGKRINTLTLTLSYTTGNDRSSNWMERLPRIASRSKSQGTSFTSEYSEDEKGDVPPGQLPPIGIPKLALRRQKDEDYEHERPFGRPKASGRNKRRKRKSGLGFGGPVSDSAIAPQRNSEHSPAQEVSETATPDEKADRHSSLHLNAEQLARLQSAESDPETEKAKRKAERELRRKERGRSQDSPEEDDDVEVEAYEEGHHLIIEDEEGNVLETVDTHGKSKEEKAAIIEQTKAKLRHDSSGQYAKHKHEPHEKTEGEDLENELKEIAEQPEKKMRDHFKSWKGFGRMSQGDVGDPSKKPERKRGPAHAYQFGNTIIVEDEDGEVIHKYDIPREGREENKYNEYVREYMQKMGTWVGIGRRQSQAQTLQTDSAPKVEEEDTSTSSPDKEKHEVEIDVPDETDTKTRRPQQRTPSDRDDGLRLVISNTEQYGLTGLRKQKPGERPGFETGGGRRLSTQDFIREMQQLDKQNRTAAMNEAGIGRDFQDQINRSTASKMSKGSDTDRPRILNRAGTMPLSRHKSPIEEENEEASEDYFSTQNSSRQRSRSDAARRTRPEAHRSYTAESTTSDLTNDGHSDEDIPTHNIRSTVARHVQGGTTSADARRQRYKSQSESTNRIAEEAEEDDPNAETAAEKRRRLAALGIGGEAKDSSDEDEESPRVKRAAVQEPGLIASQAPPREREKLAEPPKMRVQWGGETRGSVRGQGGDDEESQTGVGGNGSRQSGGGMGKKLRGFLSK